MPRGKPDREALSKIAAETAERAGKAEIAELCYYFSEMEELIDNETATVEPDARFHIKNRRVV